MGGPQLSPCTPSSRGMDKYEQLAVVGEGSYGVVLKCRRRDTGQFVAIKKFLETEDDAAVRKMALREIRMLKKLRHDHLVNMIEVFRRKRRFYLVFEYLDHTLLDELEGAPAGLGTDTTQKHLFQLLKGLDYCHQNSIIHRDVKPENVLVSNDGIVKLCDLGFARTLAAPGEPCTEYVATRWYRAPELLVAEHRYGTEVDIWAVGCLFAEMLTGEPLFPGDSDIDQLALIVKTVGKLAPRHQLVVAKLAGGAAPAAAPAGRVSLPATGTAKDLMAACLRTEPRARPTAAALLRHKYFTTAFVERFTEKLRRILGKEIEIPAELPKSMSKSSSSKTAFKPKPWTLNIFPDQSKSSTDSTAPADLIDYNYIPSSENLEKEAKKVLKKVCPSTKICHEMATGKTAAPHPPQPLQPPPPPPQHHKPPPEKTLAKAINEAFHTFNVPVNTFPRTPYIKKVKNKLFVDEDLKVKPLKAPKKEGDVTLPFVSGGIHPNKKVKSGKGYETFIWRRGNLNF